MAWGTPVTTWTSGAGFDYANLNRIEANIAWLGGAGTVAQSTKDNNANALVKRGTSGEIAVGAITASGNITAPGATIAGRTQDQFLWEGLSGKDGAAGTPGTQSIAAGGTWIIPKGLYLVSGSDSLKIQFLVSGSWYDTGAGGLVLSDGTNYRIRNSYSSSQTIGYLKLL